MGWLLGTRQTSSAILVFSVFLVLGLVACSAPEIVIVDQSGSEILSSDNGSGSIINGVIVQSTSSDVSLGDIACNIVSVDEIISIVGVGNDEQLVVATGAVNGDNLHCGWSSNGTRNVPNRTNLGLQAAHVTVTLKPISAPNTLDEHKLAQGFSLDNDPDAALPEYGEGAYKRRLRSRGDDHHRPN